MYDYEKNKSSLYLELYYTWSFLFDMICKISYDSNNKILLVLGLSELK